MKLLREIRYSLDCIKFNIKYYYLENFSKKYKEECERQNQEECRYFYENNIET